MTRGHEDGRFEELEDDILKLYCIISCMSWDAGSWCNGLIDKDFVLEELTRIIKGKPEYKLGDKEKFVFFDIKHKKGNRKYNTGLNNMIEVEEDILNLMESVRLLQKKITNMKRELMY